MTKTPAPHGRVPQTDFEARFRRVFEAAECGTQVELADFLAIRQSSIADAKRRKTIPPGWLLQLFEEKRVNPHWVRTGQGDKIVRVPDAAGEGGPFAAATERGPAHACGTDELLAELLRRALKRLG